MFRMDVSSLLNPLNDAQRLAVTAPVGPMLVLAGAGSGKTRVLVHRIAWLMAVENASPYSILAVTFTNKAAAEMRGRLAQLLEIPVNGMWAGTFHGLAHRLLRAHWREAGLPEGFQILDADDQQRLIRRLLKALNMDDAKWQPKQLQWFINARKDEGQRPADIDDQGDPTVRQMLRVYSAYEEACARAGVIDFAELLLRAHDLWRTHPELLAHYQQRFRHILVDEFQDTNWIQYDWIRQLGLAHHSVCLVGDDDQSIYGWRGARSDNLQRFKKDFPSAQILRLEQNYRSTGAILAAANALIANNTERLGKNLWTASDVGEPIAFYVAFNDLDEARCVVERIKQWREEGGAWSDCAVLYRSNAQSRVLEEALLMQAVPYRVYGGLRFFERAEIKDALAYLRLIANRDDDAAFERAVNTPLRGIGERSLDAVRERARALNVSLWRAAQDLLSTGQLAGRAGLAIGGFLALIDRLATETANLSLAEQVEYVIGHSGLIPHFQKEKGEKGQARLENLDELVTAARQYINEDSAMTPLAAFLSHTALESGDAQGAADQDSVQLMTLHSAKGLEFPLVFMCGMEEGLFPHQMSAHNPARLEEERRLCYVGITRARRQLYFTCAERRRLHGAEIIARPSRFIKEIPVEYLREVRPRLNVSQPFTQTYARALSGGSIFPAARDDGFALGQRVRHNHFGEGVILNCEGSGASARVQINFAQGGAKWLVVAYANLQPL